MSTGFVDEGKHGTALREMDAVLAMDSSFSPAYFRKVQPYAKLGMMKEVFATSLRGVEVSGRSSESLSLLGYCSGLMGRREETIRIVKELELRNFVKTCPGYYIARVYAGLGDRNNIFKWLNTDVQDHAGTMIWFAQDKEWDPYRTDQRFVDVLKKVGLEK